MPKILIIEDDDSVATALRDLLKAEGFSVDMATDPVEGLADARAKAYDLVVSDLQMPGLSGLEVVEQLQSVKPHLPVILITAYHTTEAAIRAIKLGAFDYVLKPIDPSDFLRLLKRALESTRVLAKPLDMGESSSVREAIIGKSKVMQTVYKEIGRVAAMPVTVLVQGETGTGKELVARAIHQHSDRAVQPFVTVNCAAIPENLLESELFGHEAGAFTGAKNRHIGRFEQANSGTIFLDEIGDMSASTQVKLLRVLQEKTISRVGGKETISVDVRIIAATHRNLEEAIEAREFRLDLFHRLNVAVIYLPPLTQRREDIPDLVAYFLNRYSVEFNLERPSLAADAVDFLQQQSWPGNVRELENIVRKALIASRGYPINLEHIRTALTRPTPPRPAGDQRIADLVAELLTGAQLGETGNVSEVVTEAVEREVYGQAIRLANGDQTKAARWLGVSRPTMRDKLTRYNLFPVRGDARTESRSDTPLTAKAPAKGLPRDPHASAYDLSSP
jgi:DNA-binding NtrC family response regulator